jgi:hypothetical protein
LSEPSDHDGKIGSRRRSQALKGSHTASEGQISILWAPRFPSQGTCNGEQINIVYHARLCADFRGSLSNREKRACPVRDSTILAVRLTLFCRNRKTIRFPKKSHSHICFGIDLRSPSSLFSSRRSLLATKLPCSACFENYMPSIQSVSQVLIHASHLCRSSQSGIISSLFVEWRSHGYHLSLANPLSRVFRHSVIQSDTVVSDFDLFLTYS